ncbi:hypothetical protein PQQ75_25360 [Paraburkholderia aspalathi]|uniref:hypothetical protein n=1 Tax=Paraburkholderia aspalathi TaxID=1324617 RepID=UPI0038B958C3
MADAALAELRRPPAREEEDFKLNLFTSKGFALAQRIAMAYQEASAVPALFRRYVTKREKNGSGYREIEVENPSAFGNMLIAIETAQAIGMSITAVMQNANIIEGKLTWSGKFLIAAINASGLFTNLRFRVVNKGTIKVKYKEKGAWNDNKRGFDYVEHEVEIENLECTAWAYAIVRGQPDMSEKIEGAPVSMKMAVEEGWYSKPGSKWQGEMKHLMLQYRAGSFFGNIHAPQITMGMGKTTEEQEDIIDVYPTPDGKYAVDLEALGKQAAGGPSEAAQQSKADSATTVESKDIPPEDPKAGPTSAASDASQTPAPTPTPAPAPAPAATPASAIGTEFDRPDQAGELFGGAGPQYTNEDTCEMAIEFASKGDYDSALDLKLNLPDAMKKRIDTAIQSHKAEVASAAEKAQAKQATAPRPRRSYDV